MKVEYAAKIYELFDEFIEKCIINGNSLLTGEAGKFTDEAIEEVIQNFVRKPIEGSDQNFDQKVETQLAKDKVSYEARLVMSHAIWLWCMSPMSFTQWRKKHASTALIKDFEGPWHEDAFQDTGFGSAGSYLNRNKVTEITFNILLIKFLRSKVIEGVSDFHVLKRWAVHYILKARFDEDNEDYPLSDKDYVDLPSGKLVMYNILLHLTFPDEYERMASENHKNALYNAFRSFINDAPDEIQEANRDRKILYIREQISKLTGKPEIDFYNDEYQEIWNTGGGYGNFDHMQALQYKKALVFYGPPGTSKTHSANALATSLVYQHYFKDPDNVKEYFEDKNKMDVSSERVHRLQLHQNYAYEDFIAGIQIIDGNTKPVKGYLLELIEKIKDDKFPHVLILDEINRVDVSRLFGELFSAIENRETPIKTSIGNFEIRVPKNLHIIGTMNEIDFSLERLDFALRRRFVWSFMGFEEGTLRHIIDHKEGSSKIKKEHKDWFIEKTVELNKAIDKHPDLGTMYQIGHTFFAEIVDIYLSYMNIDGRSKQYNLFINGGPVNILWDISIRPMLEAFLGNMDEQSKKEEIAKLSKAYFGA